MVKGNTRQVVVVKAPDGRLFEQAIFLLREDALEKNGVGEAELLEEARRIADGYAAPRRARRATVGLKPLLWGAMGAAPVALAWILTAL